MWLARIPGKVTCAEAAAPESKKTESKIRNLKTTLLQSNIKNNPWCSAGDAFKTWVPTVYRLRWVLDLSSAYAD